MLNKLLLSFVILALNLVNPLCSLIVEVKHFKEILNYLEPNSLIILDIDDTLLLPVQTLGRDSWFQYRLRYHQTKESSYELALDKALAEWEAIRHLTEVEIVEEGTEKVIEELQSSYNVMGLTTQSLTLSSRTVNQLLTLNIDLSKNPPWPHDYYFINKVGVLYYQGILFTSGTRKGQALLKLLDHISYTPSHIIFINDKETHLQDVEEAVLAKGIAFTGLRYSYRDAEIASFNPEIAAIQWQQSSFDHLLSDEEAQQRVLNH